MESDEQNDNAVKLRQFFEILNGCFGESSFVKLILGKYRGDEKDLRTIKILLIKIQEQDTLSFVHQYKTKDITKNFPVKDGIETVRGLLGKDFKSAHLFSLTGDVQLEFSKRDRCILNSSRATCSDVPVKIHNREKERMIDQDRAFLTALGITGEDHKVLHSMNRKWKQINVFLEIFQRALLSSQLSKMQNINVVDFGSGKGYLTFAVYDFLRNSQKMDPQVTGVELREELVRLCNDVARELEMGKLHFCQGDLKSYNPGKTHIMIALHACDTATDLAIHMGIRSGAEIIMCAPCCHKELRPQIVVPSALKASLRFGVHLGQEAEMVTDSLRALLLEASGYETQVFEFISLEHTSKNKMILAVKRCDVPEKKEEALSQIKAIKDFYGIREVALEELLKNSIQ
ncbi:MAG TPA: methyltransferase [Lentisphaeria bacterium]|nr:MAG: methyltransferase [Lentisphaerae bacterium GWF2_49_21]HBC88927.1 methyltransferase [Lentisphaeria bacterium]